jgi:WD40 repeat protein
MRLLLAAGIALFVAASWPVVGEDVRPARTDTYGDPLPEGAIARLGTVRSQPASGAHCVAYSPDGKTLATGDRDDVIRFRDSTTGKETLQLAGHQGTVRSLAFSPDGKLLASASNDGTVRLWDVASGRPAGSFSGRTASRVVFALDGKRMAVSDDNGGVVVRDLATGQKLREIAASEKLTLGSPLPLVFAPDGQSLFTLDEDRVVRLWDLTTGKPLHDFAALNNTVRVLAISPNGKVLAAGDAGGHVRLWDTRTRQELHTLSGHLKGVSLLTFAPDGKTLTSVGLEGILCVWDVASGKQSRWISGLPSSPVGVAFSPDGKFAAFAGQVLRLIDVTTGKTLLPQGGHQSAVSGVAFSSDGKLVASASADGTVGLWDPRSGQDLRWFVTGSDSLKPVAFSPDGKRIAASGQRDLYLWQVTTGAEVRRFHCGSTDYFAFVADGKGIVCGNDFRMSVELLWIDGREPTVFWQRDDLPFRKEPGEHSSIPVAVTPDGRKLVGPSSWWDLATAEEHRWEGNPGWGIGTRLVFAPGGKILAAVDPGGTVRLVEFASRRTISEIRDIGRFLVFSPDGRTLATSGPGPVVHLIEVATGKVRRLAGHRGGVNAASFSPDGQLLATASNDQTVLIWDLRDSAKRVTVRHSPDVLQRFWTDLDNPDPARAYQALWSLADAPEQTPAFLADHVRTLLIVDRDRITRWIADLDDDDFDVRDRARLELERIGDRAEATMRRALAASPSAEVRRQLRALLERLETGESFDARRRLLRVVETLETIGTPAARRELQHIVDQAPVSWLAGDAEDALKRLAVRTNPGR